MATLASLSKRLRETFNNSLVKAQKAYENPTRIKTPRFDETKMRSIPLNAASGFAESLINEPVSIVKDVGTGVGKAITGDLNNFNPTSNTMRLTNNVIDSISTRQNPFSTVKLSGYGKGKWNVPFTSTNLPEMGFSESPAAGMAKQAVGILEPFMAVTGAKKPLAAAGYIALGGGANALLGDRKDSLEQRLIKGANTAAPDAAVSAGFLTKTNPFLDNIGGKAITRLPLKSGANVAQGIGLNELTGQENSGASVLLDALFPLAGELMTKTFKSSQEAVRATEARLKSVLGKSIRNNKGMYTTAEKFAKGTRPYRKSGKYAQGGLLGFEPYQDEDGSWKVRFSREKALLGLGFTAGISKAGNLTDDVLKNIDGKSLNDKVPQVFNTSKFNVTKAEDKALYSMLKKMGIDERTVRSFDEMKDVATELLGDPQKLLRDVASGRIKDSEVVALGDIISTSTKRIGLLTKQLERAPTDTKLLTDLDNETEIINQAIRKRVKGGTEAGRAVVAFRILANKTMSPEFWLSKAQKQLGGTRNLKSEEIAAINQLIKNQDRLGLSRFVGLLGESSFAEKALSLWKAGLLSSPKTHIANILANSIFAPMETIKDIPATGFDMVRSVVTGTPRSKAFGIKSITSQVGGAKRGAIQGLDFIKSGVDQRDIQKFDVLRGVRFGETRGGRLAQKYVDGVFRLLGAEDKIPREMAFNRSIADQALTRLANKDISATELQDLLVNPTEDMVNLAIKDSQLSTFNNSNVLSEGIKRFKSVDPKLAVGADIMMPFVRTPTNVLLRMVDYTPAGFAGAVLKKIRNGQSVTDREFADAFGRSATGMTILAAGYALASQGLYQGASPSGEAERSQMYLEGRQPTSVRLGDTWYQVSKLSPFAQLLGIGAAYFNATGGVGNKTLQAGLQGIKSFSELPMIAGLSSASDAVSDPERGGKKYVEQALGGLVPNVIKGVATGTSDVMRSRDTAMDSIIAGIPALNQGLPIRVDALGNPIPVNGVMTTLLNPFNPKEVNKDPVVQEFARVGYNLNYVGDNIDKQKLIPEQQRAYQKLAGAKIREYIVPVLESEEYQTADIDTQNDIITRVVNKAKSDARDEIRPLLQSITKGSDRGPKALATEKEAEKTRGGVTIIKRGKDIGAWDQGNKGTQQDHKTALSLGGTNKKSNQMILTNEENKQKGIVEAHFAREVDKGNLTIKEANKRMEGWGWKEEYTKLQASKDTSESKPKTVKEVYSLINPATGKTQNIDISEELIRPKATGETELDKELFSAFNSKITTRINNIEKLYLAGEMTAKEAEEAITELKALRTGSSRGAGKSKKKGIKVALPKITLSTIPISKTNIKPATFKLKKAPKLKLKAAKPTSIKLAKKNYSKGKPIKFRNTLSDSLTKLV